MVGKFRIVTVVRTQNVGNNYPIHKKGARCFYGERNKKQEISQVIPTDQATDGESDRPTIAKKKILFVRNKSEKLKIDVDVISFVVSHRISLLRRFPSD